MRNSWTRAWLAALASIVLAVVIGKSREEWLLRVEKPVMDWLLDGTDTSIWDNALILSSWWIIAPATLFLAIVAWRMEPRITLAILTTTLLSYALTGILSGLVGRVGPAGETVATFPSFEVVKVGVFVGLVVLSAWWVGAPKLLWHILLELATVLTLIVAIREIISGAAWPSDTLAAGLVTALALITAAILFEANPAPVRTRSKIKGTAAAKFKKQSKEKAAAA